MRIQKRPPFWISFDIRLLVAISYLKLWSYKYRPSSRVHPVAVVVLCPSVRSVVRPVVVVVICPSVSCPFSRRCRRPLSTCPIVPPVVVVRPLSGRPVFRPVVVVRPVRSCRPSELLLTDLHVACFGNILAPLPWNQSTTNIARTLLSQLVWGRIVRNIGRRVSKIRRSRKAKTEIL